MVNFGGCPVEDVIFRSMEAASGVLEQTVGIGELTETMAGAVELVEGGLKSATQWAATCQSLQAVERVVADARVACNLVPIAISTDRRADLAYSLLGSTGVQESMRLSWQKWIPGGSVPFRDLSPGRA